jgi:hypothetical protein
MRNLNFAGNNRKRKGGKRLWRMHWYHLLQSTYFWIIARSVRDFVANEGDGQLPLSGKLPDMKSDTKNYVGLQNA